MFRGLVDLGQTSWRFLTILALVAAAAIGLARVNG
jgi:hypothetical protein